MEAELSKLRSNVGAFLAVPSEVKIRSKEEEGFWSYLATPSLLHQSNPPSWWNGDESSSSSSVPSKLVLPLSSVDADNLRVSHQRSNNEVQHLRDQVQKLEAIEMRRRPVIQRLTTTAKTQASTHKRQLMAAVRRIAFVVQERDEAVTKFGELRKYVAKLEAKALAIGKKKGGSSSSSKAGVPTVPAKAQFYRELAPPPPPGGGAKSKVQSEITTRQSTTKLFATSSSKNNERTNVASLYSQASERAMKSGYQKMVVVGGSSTRVDEVTEEHRRRKLELSKRSGGKTTTMATTMSSTLSVRSPIRSPNNGVSFKGGRGGRASDNAHHHQPESSNSPPTSPKSTQKKKITPRNSTKKFQRSRSQSPGSLERTLLDHIIADEATESREVWGEEQRRKGSERKAEGRREADETG
jgi:hypothetical protein